MGNQTSAASGESTAASLAPPPFPPPTALENLGQENAGCEDKNPGTFEELHKRCKGMYLFCGIVS